MTFEGLTLCPVCSADLARALRDVLRKADDVSASVIDCPNCDAPIVVHARIVHHVEIVKDT
jgi:uncharacterized protein with PIN domain